MQFLLVSFCDMTAGNEAIFQTNEWTAAAEEQTDVEVEIFNLQ